MLKLFFGDFNSKTTFLLKSGTIFDDVAKLGKATWDAYILTNFVSPLKNWVAKGVISKVNYFRRPGLKERKYL